MTKCSLLVIDGDTVKANIESNSHLIWSNAWFAPNEIFASKSQPYSRH